MTRALVLSGNHTFADIVKPLRQKLRPYYLVADAQSGGYFSGPDGAADESKLLWRVPAFENTSTLGFKPGIVPAMLTASQSMSGRTIFCLLRPRRTRCGAPCGSQITSAISHFRSCATWL